MKICFLCVQSLAWRWHYRANPKVSKTERVYPLGSMTDKHWSAPHRVVFRFLLWVSCRRPKVLSAGCCSSPNPNILSWNLFCHENQAVWVGCQCNCVSMETEASMWLQVQPAPTFWPQVITKHQFSQWKSHPHHHHHHPHHHHYHHHHVCKSTPTNQHLQSAALLIYMYLLKYTLKSNLVHLLH